jgi:hypothetical protein
MVVLPTTSTDDYRPTTIDYGSSTNLAALNQIGDGSDF